MRLTMVRPGRRVQVMLDDGRWILGTLDAERDVAKSGVREPYTDDR